MTRDQVHVWLLNYAWAGTVDQQHRHVECIMAQDGWTVINVRADQYAGAQAEPGPDAYASGMEWALSALYECHAGPHIAECPESE